MRARVAVPMALVLGLAFAPAASAQTGTSLGGKFGLNFANTPGDIPDTKTRTAFSFGAALEAQFSRFFGVEFDALYSLKGSRNEFVQNNVPVEQKLQLSYLELPVLLKLLVPVEGSALRPALYGGPVLAVQVGCTIDTNVQGQKTARACDDSQINFQTKTLDFGFQAGAGLGFGLGLGTFMVDLRFAFGLTDINDTPADNRRVTNQVVQLMAGYVFPLGR